MVVIVLLSDVRLHEDDDVDHERGETHGEGGPGGYGAKPIVERYQPRALRCRAEPFRYAQRLRPHRHGARQAHHQHDRYGHAKVAERAPRLQQ